MKTGRRTRLTTHATEIAAAGVLLLSTMAAMGQTPVEATGNGHMTIGTVMDDAEQNYPSIHISEEDLNISVANIRLAKTAYLPRVDGIAQFNRATRNNVFGTLLPEGIIPSMSGPVIGSNNGGSVWGSATGLLVNWQPFDFGARHANVQVAGAAHNKAIATNQRTQLEVGAESADAYLTLLAASQMKTAAQSAVDSWETLRRSVHALVTAELRPAADESRVNAEKAAAQTQLALAGEAVETARSTLTKFLTKVAMNAEPAPGRMLSDLPALPDESAAFTTVANPAMAEQQANVSQASDELRAIERSWVPQFNLEAAGYARGTGAETNGNRLPGTNGLVPNYVNYAAGINITFPFMDFASIHAREASQAASVRAAEANEQLVDRTLQQQFAAAKAELNASRAVAQNTPVELEATKTALAQATARYKAGLAPIDDVAQTQRLLVQATIDDAIARLNVWRAFLHVQFVRGDLQPFLQEANR